MFAACFRLCCDRKEPAEQQNYSVTVLESKELSPVVCLGVTTIVEGGLRASCWHSNKCIFVYYFSYKEQTNNIFRMVVFHATLNFNNPFKDKTGEWRSCSFDSIGAKKRQWVYVYQTQLENISDIGASNRWSLIRTMLFWLFSCRSCYCCFATCTTHRKVSIFLRLAECVLCRGKSTSRSRCWMFRRLWCSKLNFCREKGGHLKEVENFALTRISLIF